MRFYKKESEALIGQTVEVSDIIDGKKVLVKRKVVRAFGVKTGRNSEWGVEFDKPLNDGAIGCVYNLLCHDREVSWASEAGFTKTTEQMELIEQQAFENDHKETLQEAKAGLYAKSEEIYNATQVKMLISEAIRKHDQTTIIALRNIQGMYKLPDAVDALIRDLELNKEEVNCG